MDSEEKQIEHTVSVHGVEVRRHELITPHIRSWMKMDMRAKMRIQQVITHDNCEELMMSAVCKSEGYDEGGLDENNTFATFTPSAELSMVINNPVLRGKFKEGQELYIDFTIAD